MHSQSIDIWIADTRLAKPNDVERYERLLDQGERYRLERFRNLESRIEYLIGRVLIRTLLSNRFTNVDPTLWRFKANAYGRPYIEEPNCSPYVNFSLTHKRHLVACGLSYQEEFGIDLEYIEPLNDIIGIAEQFHSSTEMNDLMASSTEQEQLIQFFRRWTLKESYVKARGLGLSLNLRDVCFSYDQRTQDRFSISFGPSILDDPSSWNFKLNTLNDKYILSAGYRCISNTRYSINYQNIHPAEIGIARIRN